MKHRSKCDHYLRTESSGDQSFATTSATSEGKCSLADLPEDATPRLQNIVEKKISHFINDILLYHFDGPRSIRWSLKRKT